MHRVYLSPRLVHARSSSIRCGTPYGRGTTAGEPRRRTSPGFAGTSCSLSVARAVPHSIYPHRAIGGTILRSMSARPSRRSRSSGRIRRKPKCPWPSSPIARPRPRFVARLRSAAFQLRTLRSMHRSSPSTVDARAAAVAQGASTPNTLSFPICALPPPTARSSVKLTLRPPK